MNTVESPPANVTSETRSQKEESPVPSKDEQPIVNSPATTINENTKDANDINDKGKHMTQAN